MGHLTQRTIWETGSKGKGRGLKGDQKNAMWEEQKKVLSIINHKRAAQSWWGQHNVGGGVKEMSTIFP